MEASLKDTSIPDSTISWLMASETPSIRYLALRELLHKPVGDAEVKATQEAITTSKPIQAIFARQKPEGFWNTHKHYYSPKYRSSHWTMYLLTELAIPPEHPQMQLGAEHMLRRMEDEVPYYHEEKTTGFSCFWGNWLRYELYCGKLGEPKVAQVIDFICRDIHRLGRCRYNYDKPCAWGVVRSLNGLAMIPERARSQEVEMAIERGIRFLIEENDLVRADYPYEDKVNELWGRLSFPLFYHTDILFVLCVLQKLNALDRPGAQAAIAWLKGKQKKDGRWRGGSPFRKRTRPFVVEPDTPSHWITLQAASILQFASA